MPRGSDWRGRRRGGRQIAAPAATLGPLALQRRKERADDRQTLEDAHVRPRDGSTPSTDTVLAAVNLAAMVYTVRNVFARCRLLTEACRHLLETLRGRAFPPGLDDSIADKSLDRQGRQLTVPQEGRRSPAPDQLTYIAAFAWPARCWIAGTDGNRHGLPPSTSGPESPVLPCRTRSAPPAPHPFLPGTEPGRDRIGRRPHRASPRRPSGVRAALRRPPRPGRRPHPGAAGRGRPRPPAGCDAGTAGRPHDRSGDVDAYAENLARFAAFKREADARRAPSPTGRGPSSRPKRPVRPASSTQHPGPNQGRGAAPESWWLEPARAEPARRDTT